MLAARDALLRELQRERIRQEIIERELAGIERAMAARSIAGHQPLPLPQPGMAPGSMGVWLATPRLVQDAWHDRSPMPTTEQVVPFHELRSSDRSLAVYPSSEWSLSRLEPVPINDMEQECQRSSGPSAGVPVPVHGAEQEHQRLVGSSALVPMPIHGAEQERRRSFGSPAGVPMYPDVECGESLSQDPCVEETLSERAVVYAEVEQHSVPPTGSAVFNEPERQGSFGQGRYTDVDKDHDMHISNKGKNQSVLSRSRRSLVEDQTNASLQPPFHDRPVHEGNAEVDVQKKSLELNETTPTKKTFSGGKRKMPAVTPPAKKQNSLQKWSCTLCQVKATSEHNLEGHYAGQRHQSNVAALKSRKEATGLKGKATTEPLPGTQQKTPWTKWYCSICQANCACESNLENHFRGRRHQVNVLALQRDGKDIVGDGELQEAKLYEKNVPRLAEMNQRPPSRWSCNICHTNCTCESDLEIHLRGRRHQKNIEALHREGKNTKASMGFLGGFLSENNVSRSAQKKPKRFQFCTVCNLILRCNSEKMLKSHLGGKKHKAMLNAHK